MRNYCRYCLRRLLAFTSQGMTGSQAIHAKSHSKRGSKSYCQCCQPGAVAHVVKCAQCAENLPVLVMQRSWWQVYLFAYAAHYKHLISCPTFNAFALYCLQGAALAPNGSRARRVVWADQADDTSASAGFTMGKSIQVSLFGMRPVPVHHTLDLAIFNIGCWVLVTANIACSHWHIALAEIELTSCTAPKWIHTASLHAARCVCMLGLLIDDGQYRNMI